MNYGLKKAREKNAERKRLGIKTKRLNPIEKFEKNPTSRKFAIYAHCWECSNFQKNEVMFCTIPNCPLYTFRPYQKKSKS